jgi:hypothetical protein
MYFYLIRAIPGKGVRDEIIKGKYSHFNFSFTCRLVSRNLKASPTLRHPKVRSSRFVLIRNRAPCVLHLFVLNPKELPFLAVLGHGDFKEKKETLALRVQLEIKEWSDPPEVPEVKELLAQLDPRDHRVSRVFLARLGLLVPCKGFVSNP